jgi:type IV secretion system protein VirB6
MIACAAPATGPSFLAQTLNHLDCQAQNIGAAGYQALAGSGSPIALVLTALLALFVAFIGLRFLTGRPMGVNELIPTTLKVGFVLALATSWPAYQTVIYDVVLKGPSEIASSISGASSLPGAGGGMTARLQGVDNGIMALVEAGSGRLDITARRPTDAIAPPLADDMALGWGKTLFVSSIIGSFGLLRLAGGLFLALAPLFAGLLLFEATRFLFFGWLRALVAVALGSIGLAIVLGVELAIIEPWLSQLLAMRSAKIATLSAPFELLALTLAFSLTMIGVFIFVLRISFTSAVVTKVQAVIEQTAQNIEQSFGSSEIRAASNEERASDQSRAQLIAQSLNQTLRRENGEAAYALAGAGITSNRAVMTAITQLPQATTSTVPLGRTYPSPSRRLGSQTLNRRSAS